MAITYDTFISRLFAKATETGTPLSGTFELTSRCTLDCKMCYIHKKENEKSAIEKEKPTEWWLDLAEKARQKGMLLLLLTGGECMLREDFEEIYLACKKMGLLVTINTNATLIDEKKIQLFKANPPQRVNITLYGMSRETYGNLCGNPNAFDKVVWAIKALKEAGINVKINYTVTPYNKDDVFAASDFAKELELPIQTVTYLFPPLRAEENAKCKMQSAKCRGSSASKHYNCVADPTLLTPHSSLLTNSDWHLASGEAHRLSPQSAAQVLFNLQKHRLGDDFIDFLKYKQKEKPQTDYFDDCDKEGQRIRCRAGSTTFWVTWDGKMTPCGMMVEPVAEIGEDFNEAWQKIRKEREEIILPPQCTNCEYKASCDICAAVSYAETGKFNGLPTYVCEKAKAYAELVKQVL